MNENYLSCFENALNENLIRVDSRVPIELEQSILWMAFNQWLIDKFGELYNSETYLDYCSYSNFKDFLFDNYAIKEHDYPNLNRDIFMNSPKIILSDEDLLDKIFNHLGKVSMQRK